MGAFTTAAQKRIEQCRKNALEKSEQKRRAAFATLAALQQEKRPVTKAALARQAGVSVVFLRKHPDLLQAIEEAGKAETVPQATETSVDRAKDQVIASLRRRLESMKKELTTKEAELRQKQREIDQLYGKLAANSPLTDAELRCTLAEALERLAQGGATTPVSR